TWSSVKEHHRKDQFKDSAKPSSIRCLPDLLRRICYQQKNISDDRSTCDQANPERKLSGTGGENPFHVRYHSRRNGQCQRSRKGCRAAQKSVVRYNMVRRLYSSGRSKPERILWSFVCGH